MPLRDFEHGETREYERDQTQDGFNQRGAALSRGMTPAAAGKDWHCSEVRSKLALEKGLSRIMGDPNELVDPGTII